jgi:hypothetical protein
VSPVTSIVHWVSCSFLGNHDKITIEGNCRNEDFRVFRPIWAKICAVTCHQGQNCSFTGPCHPSPEPLVETLQYIKQMPRITMYMFVLHTPLGAREFPNFSDWYQIHLLFFIPPFRRPSRTNNELCLKCMPNCMASCFHCIFFLPAFSFPVEYLVY